MKRDNRRKQTRFWPVTPRVYKEAEQRGVELVVDKTEAICRLLEESRPKEINAILHVTC